MYRTPKILLTVTLALFFLSDKLIAEENLSWKGCLEEARKNNPDLISSQENVKESEAAKKITASSLYPQIDSSAGVSKTKTTVTSSGNKTSKTSDAYSVGVTGTQLLFDGSKTSDNLKAASENIKAARYNYKFTSSGVRLRLRTAFVNLLKSQELLNITREIYNIRRGDLELITLRYESGIEHRGALLTAEANLVQAEFEISQAGRALEVAQRQIIKEMGRSQFSPIRVEADFKVKEKVSQEPDFLAMADTNPALGKVIAQKNAASFGLKAAEANFLPQLQAQAGANKSGSHLFPQDEQLNAGLTVSFPLFEGGLRAAEVSQAEAQFNQAQADERSTKDSVILTLEETWAALQDAVETVEVENKFLDAAQERSKIAEAQYSLGLIQFDNWTIIEDDLVRAKKTFLDAQANALLAEANWVNAKGETLEYAD